MLKRAWQIYVAHVFLFAIYLAEIAYVAQSFDNPLYSEEMGILDFLKQPDVTILQALLLKFKPVNMDVLPLYIVLLLGFAPVAVAAAAQSVARARRLRVTLWLDVVVRLELSRRIRAAPGCSIRSPGSCCSCSAPGARSAARNGSDAGCRRRLRIGLAFAYLLFAFSIAMTWYFPRLGAFVPKLVADHLYPIDKTNLDVLRILHFLSLAVITVWLVPREWPALKSRWLWPAIVCGQHSLETFCLGVFLSFAAHFVFTEVSNTIPVQVAVSLLGIVIMVGAAALISWYRRVERRGAGPRPPQQERADSRGAKHENAGIVVLAGAIFVAPPCFRRRRPIRRRTIRPNATRARAQIER